MLTHHAMRTMRSTVLRRALMPSLTATSLPTTNNCNNSRPFSTAPASNKTPWLDFLREHTTCVHEIVSKPDMFCRQCEQTSNHFACTTVGICGKSSETACIQDTLMQLIRSVGELAVAANEKGGIDLKPVHVWTLQATFSTLTNVNFSDDRIAEFIEQGVAVAKDLEAKLDSAPSTVHQELDGLAVEELEEKGLEKFSIPTRQKEMGNDDAFCLNELATYGLKGACAYAAHCYQLGYLKDDIMMDIHKINAQLNSSEPDMEGLLAACLKVGEINTRVLALLDEAHATQFGDPEPTQVCTTAVQGKCILISGHDLVDLQALLEQTEGTGINVYTHGEMLPAHAYPELKKYKHLVGNYGTAWQNQKFEFAGFPGPIIVTTNCVLEPRKMYKKRVYTMNEVGVDGVQHIGPDRDFSPVIAQAKSLKGFPRTIEPAKHHTVGFNHRAVLPLAEQVLDAAKSGALSRIFLIGGCDGSQWDRSYFTELAQETPPDSLILTLGCAKNRIIHDEDLLNAKLANGLPRVLDMGQCNDAFSAVVVATELAKALDCSINDLPLSLAVSHLEQKAAAVLLTLLHLGVKNIRLGPTLPAYLTPNVIKILQDEYNLMATGEPIDDLELMMEGK
ncbi:Hydroxylamine reductase [Seminavis robusta]|uniref:Hydroxylamine reductase n=1 Tax=Seminavis robusta TaxID=568900 RepID=A0A9N8HQX4_9STRA|nr:Hydroxylamine reductase [Seminavis robusta]|eukprot:Sro1024_g232690.1 Hydroxylamine reductase (619) ;mRNA; f:27344-29309